jgi:hypothetical protein
MTYTAAVNPHACGNGPRPEDAHDAVRPPQHPPHTATNRTNNDRLRRKTDVRPFRAVWDPAMMQAWRDMRYVLFIGTRFSNLYTTVDMPAF